MTKNRHIRWDKHLSATFRSLIYKFISNILNIHHLKILYYALVESRLRYGILRWDGVAESHLEKLTSAQKCFLKIIYKRNTLTHQMNL